MAAQVSHDLPTMPSVSLSDMTDVLACFAVSLISLVADRWDGLGIMFDTYANSRHSVSTSLARVRLRWSVL